MGPNVFARRIEADVPNRAVDPKILVGDNAYDVDAIRQDAPARNAVAVIPPKANREAPAPFDKELYKVRSAVECTLNLLKQAPFRGPL